MLHYTVKVSGTSELEVISTLHPAHRLRHRGVLLESTRQGDVQGAGRKTSRLSTNGLSSLVQLRDEEIETDGSSDAVLTIAEHGRADCAVCVCTLGFPSLGTKTCV